MTSQNDVSIIPDVASLLKVTEKTVYSLVRKGNLPAFKVKTNAAATQSANNGVKPLRFRWED